MANYIEHRLEALEKEVFYLRCQLEKLSSKPQVELKSKWWTTDQAAEFLKVKPESIRVGLCRKGSYHGVVPKKTGSRKLYWNAEDIQSLVK